MTDFYFAYGSNMSRSRLQARIGTVESVGAHRLDGFRLAFNKPSKDGSGKANLVPAADTHVWGVVWRIGADRWPALDRFEPGYARSVVQLESAGTSSPRVGVYLHHAMGRDIPPFDWYVDHILEGAREHTLPADWIEALVRQRLGARPGEPDGSERPAR